MFTKLLPSLSFIVLYSRVSGANVAFRYEATASGFTASEHPFAPPLIEIVSKASPSRQKT
jgi:hypothetical protein